MSKDKKGDLPIDGVKEASDLLAALDPESRARILKGIASQNPTLAETLKKNLFSFEQVLNLKPTDLYKVFQLVPNDLLVLSLRGLDPKIFELFLKGFSVRQASQIKEEMLSQGPRKLSDIKTAQEKIVEIAVELHGQGQISLT